MRRRVSAGDVRRAGRGLPESKFRERRAKPQAASNMISMPEGSGTLAKAAARSCSKLAVAPGMGALGREVL